MKRLHYAIGFAALLAGCSGCSTVKAPTAQQLVMAPEQGLTAAHGAHLIACTFVESAHANGTLKGAAFNKFKALCLSTEDKIDSADQLLAAGKTAEAVVLAQSALVDISTIPTK